MSYFEKLSIQGIRCFGPDQSDVGTINFGLPLTLILGNNGCGKTTIIEALNFATSGKFPPGCEGPQSRPFFVHDPKLASRFEVRGQIKLQVRDVKGQEVAVVRTVSAIQKAIKPQFKSIDQTVSRKDPNMGWQSLTGRCADADVEMCLALGVSKPILSNVLLCHQEDSNWPLDEDGKVKAKFDEIFGSEKYNKCLDEIRLSMKKLGEAEKNLKVEIKSLETNRSDASGLRSRLEGAEERYTNYEAQVREFQSKLEPIQGRLKELAVKEDEISEIRSILQKHKAHLEATRTTIADLRSTITNIFHGPTEELETTLENFSKELKVKQNSLEKLELRDAEARRKLEKVDESLSTEQTRLGQLNGDLEANKKRMETRGQAMLKLSETLGLDASVSQVSQADELSKLLNDLESAVVQKETELSLLKEKHSAAVSSLQKETFVVRENRAKIDSNIRSKKEQLRKNEEELRKVRGSIAEADQSAQLLGQLQSKLDKIKKDLEEMAKSEDTDSLKSDISSGKQEVESLEDELTKLEKQVSDLQLLSKVQAELEVQKNAKFNKDKEIEKLLSRHRSTLKELLQVDELPEQGIKFQLEARMDQFADRIKAKMEELKRVERDITTKEAEIRHVTQRLKDAKQQLEADDFAVQQACDGKDYDEYTAELSEKLSKLQDEKGTLSSSDFFYRRYVHKLQKSKCCPLCSRGFEEEEGVNKLVTELTMKMREVPSKLRENKEQLDGTQEKYEKLLQLKSRHDKVAVLRSTEIPSLENNLDKTNRELKKLKNVRNELQEELEGPQTMEVMAKSIHSDVCVLEQNLTDSRRLGKETAKIEEKLRGQSGTTKTLQEAVDEQKEKRAAVLLKRRTVEALESKLRNIENKKIKLQEEKHTVQDQQFKISGNAQRRAQLSERKDELEGVESVIQMELQEMAAELASVSRQIEQNERKIKSLQASNSAEAEELEKKMRDIYKRFGDIKQLNTDIIEYELSGGPKRLEICKQTIDKLHKSKDELNIERESNNDRCEEIKRDIASQETRRRELQDNLKLKAKEEEENQYAAKVDLMNKKIGDLNLASIFEERKKLREEEARLFSIRKEAEGSLVELKKNIKSLKADLEKPHLKYAEKNYCDAVVKAEVIDKSMKDLENFYQALEWALMSYHQKKIKHINNVINELWRRVYSGNDIDAIRIVAEQEERKEASKRRAHKYRVVQTKCGTDIDMRNRCSAGQKVLACLIIRIALAETFSSHCGVLALDEPTTNLDQENIVNLSKTLLRLVRLQANRKNFQLMVITHDQEFLKVLTQLEGIEHYYKLDRNGEGKSRVIKVNV